MSMFRVNLTDLDRKGSQVVEGRIPPDDALWGDLDDGVLDHPVDVQLTFTATSSGQVLARGTLRTELLRSCRRCLTDVTVPIREELSLFWSVPDELRGSDEEEEDEAIRWLDPTSNELDMRDALREELLLRIPRFVLCDEECQGLCPLCGINRNDETCECTLEEPDPRWDALRALQND